MERHDTMMRAARYLLGAGTFAAALVAAAGSANAQTFTCIPGFGEGESTVCGHVYTDTNGSGDWNDGEGVPNVTVAMTDSGGNQVAGSPSATVDCADPVTCGYYAFTVYEPGDYWVCIVKDSNGDGVVDSLDNHDCNDTTAHPEAKMITVGPSGQVVNFPLGTGEGEVEDPPSDVWGVGTGTPGYWKNHPEAWPAAGVVVGGVTYLNQQTATLPDKTIWDAIKLMGKVAGDKTISMFAALISAKLNTTLANNTACVEPTILLADAWMSAHPVGSGVKASSTAWTSGADAWHTLLDDYNNGKLCAPHRD